MKFGGEGGSGVNLIKRQERKRYKKNEGGFPFETGPFDSGSDVPQRWVLGSTADSSPQSSREPVDNQRGSSSPSPLRGPWSMMSKGRPVDHDPRGSFPTPAMPSKNLLAVARPASESDVKDDQFSRISVVYVIRSVGRG